MLKVKGELLLESSSVAAKLDPPQARQCGSLSRLTVTQNDLLLAT